MPPAAPQAGYIPQRPCSAAMPPEDDAPLCSHPTGGQEQEQHSQQQQHSRQNPFVTSQGLAPQEVKGGGDNTLNTRGGQGGCVRDLLKVLCAACCCYTFAEICC